MGLAVERFVTSIPEHLLCFVCMDVSYPPVVVCAVEHHMAMLMPAVQSAVLKRAIEDYKYTCRHCACDWVGCLLDERKHAETCTFRDTPCTIEPDHVAVCARKLIPCPEGGPLCPEKRRSEMRKHLDEECAQWRCRVVAGCNTRSTLANLAAHEQGCSDAAEQILLERTAPGREEGVDKVIAELLTALDAFNLDSVVEDFPTLRATTTSAQRAVLLRDSNRVQL
ncbi:hypothetical protein NBRC10512_005185 [Rhodotorula toruloides]